MTAATRFAFAACALFVLGACGGSPTPDSDATEAADEAAAEALGRDTDETVLDDMIQTQDRARGVEDLTLGRKDDLEQALENSTDPAAATEEE
jgi:hypothetical protein